MPAATTRRIRGPSSSWAVQTLQNLDEDAAHLVSEDIKKLNDQAQQLEGLFDKEVPDSIPRVRTRFNNGCKKVFGKYLEGEPDPKELVSLMLEDEYGLKLAADAVKSDLSKKHQALYNRGKNLGSFKIEAGCRGENEKAAFRIQMPV